MTHFITKRFPVEVVHCAGTVPREACTSQLKRLLMYLCLAVIVPTLQQSARSEEDDVQNAELIASAPPEYRRFIERGKVRFRHDDKKLKAMGKAGLTEFHFNIKQTFNCRLNSTRSGNKQAKRISVAITDFSYEISHTVILRSQKTAADAWEDKILKHEFDHVAISTDPRVAQLVRSQVGTSFTFVVATESPQVELTENQVLAKVREELDKRRDKIQECVQSNYDLLDSVSTSGTRAIQDRSKFFEQLYLRENLLKCGLELTEDLKKLIASAKYKKIAGHYDLLTKP